MIPRLREKTARDLRSGLLLYQECISVDLKGEAVTLISFPRQMTGGRRTVKEG